MTSLPLYAYQQSTPMVLNGPDGMWLSSDQITGMGMTSAVGSTTYNIVLPSQLPVNPNATFLGISSITGTEATTGWLPASSRIPWSVAVPGTPYENIAEFVDVQTAFTTAGAQTEPVTVLILPGIHDIQPNAILPPNVNLQGWGINTSVLVGELEIVGPYSNNAQSPQWWYLGDLNLKNTNGTALSISNNGVPISGTGIIYADRVQLQGGVAADNADGGTLVFNDCIVDASNVSVRTSNFGVLNFFHSKFIPFSGGDVIYGSNSVVLLWNSQIFDGPPTNTMIQLENCFFRAMSSLFNLENVVIIDTSSQIVECHMDETTHLRFQTNGGTASSQIFGSQVHSIDTCSNCQLLIDTSVVGTLQSMNGFVVTAQNSTFDTIDLFGTSNVNNTLKIDTCTVHNLTKLSGQIASSMFASCTLNTNLALQTDQTASLYITNSFLEHAVVSNLDSGASVSSEFIGNEWRGNSPLIEVDSTNNPIFVLNSFNLVSGINLATGSATVSTSNNLASPGSVWNVNTTDAGWVWV